jgi:hypothetical protein
VAAPELTLPAQQAESTDAVNRSLARPPSGGPFGGPFDRSGRIKPWKPNG